MESHNEKLRVAVKVRVAYGLCYHETKIKAHLSTVQKGSKKKGLTSIFCSLRLLLMLASVRGISPQKVQEIISSLDQKSHLSPFLKRERPPFYSPVLVIFTEILHLTSIYIKATR